MKKILVVSAIAAISAATLMGCGTSNTENSKVDAASNGSGGASESSNNATVTLKLAHPDPPSDDSSFNQLATSFANHVSELSNGTVSIDVIPNGQMGSGIDIINAMQMGTFDMQIEVTNSFANYDFNKFVMFDLPFAFKDSAQAQEWSETEFFKKNCMDAAANELGVRILAVGNGFMRETYTTNREINSMEDYKGLKIRTPDVVTISSLYNKIGANSTPMSYGDCFTALQQGTIEGIEVPISNFISGNFNEACKYAAIDNHVYNCLSIQISEQVYQKLDKNVQDILNNAAELAAEDECKWAAEAEKSQIQKLKDLGMTVSENIDTTEMREACKPVWEEFKNKLGEDIYNEFEQWVADNEN